MMLLMKKCIPVLVLACLSGSAHPCTTFLLENDGRPVFGRNYDWYLEDGLVIANKRGVEKTAVFLSEPEGPPARWTSKYGSITFNQISREFPCGGMNEAGLVVEVMILYMPSQSRPDGRPVISNMQWIQYQLDRHATVAEVVGHLAELRIRQEAGVPMHYLVADASGAAAAIELLDGKVVCHAGKDQPVKVLTNDNYRRSYYRRLDWSRNAGVGEVPVGAGSQTRFVRACKRVEEFIPRAGRSAVDYAFDTLEYANHRDLTVWRIVYDIAAGRVYFRTQSRPAVRYVDLRAFDFTCGSPVKVLDISDDLGGDATGRFTDYTAEMNRQLVSTVFEKIGFVRKHKARALEVLAPYPESTVCAEK